VLSVVLNTIRFMVLVEDSDRRRRRRNMMMMMTICILLRYCQVVGVAR